MLCDVVVYKVFGRLIICQLDVGFVGNNALLSNFWFYISNYLEFIVCTPAHLPPARMPPP